MPVIKLIGKLLWFITKSLLTTAVVVGLFLFYGVQIEPNWIETTEQPVYIANLPAALDGFRIVQISDLHAKTFPGKELVKRVNNLRPDMVAITGDVFDEYHEIPVEYANQALGGMTAKYGIYYILGNNDLYLNTDKIKQTLSDNNVQTLVNEKIELNVKGQSLELIGLKYPRVQKVNLSPLLTGVGDRPTILLAHRPEIIKDAQENGIDLVLVGHTHGGQITAPYVPKFVTVVKKGYEKYKSGLFKVGNTQMYVNRGLGVSDTPLRFLARPEITVLTLHAK